MKRLFVVGALTAMATGAACGVSAGGGSNGQAPADGGGTTPVDDASSDAGADGASSGSGSSSSSSSGSSSGTTSSSSSGSSSSGSSSGSSSSGGPAGGLDAGGTAVLVRVTNGCPVDLWIHATGEEATLTPDNAHLTQGQSQEYLGPLTWTAARIYAYLQAPDSSGTPQGQNDKIETNFYVTNGSEYVNSDITYVDWVALPSQIQAFGSGSDCVTVGCQVTHANILDGCPASLLSGDECLSAGSYCLNPSASSDPYCHALDSQVSACASEYSDCASASGSTTAEVYSCSGTFFSGTPEYCAALNRGVLASPAASTPATSFYQSPPFNTYAQWVHQQCPGIYAFPYDDFGPGGQSSDHTCTGATELDVTFCPKG